MNTIKDLNFYFKMVKKLNKKYLQKGWSIYVPHRRVLNSACAILENIKDVPFDKLNLELYFLIEDKGFVKVANDYKRVIEIAKMQPEKFIFQLYGFYKQESRYIKTNGLTEQFFEFSSDLQGLVDQEENSEKTNVYRAYINLLMEQYSFMIKNHLHYNNIVAGVKTSGDIIEVTDLYSNFDIPTYEFEALALQGLQGDMVQLYQKWGYNEIKTVEDSEIYHLQLQLFDNTIHYMTPYINEYTIDILPSKPISPEIEHFISKIPIPKLTTDYHQLLQSRRRTLPTNGLKVKIENGFYRNTLLKEIYKNGQIVLLYKIETDFGDLCGTYKVQSGEFYSIYGHTTNSDMLVFDDMVMQFILWAYSSYVCDDSDLSLTNESYQRIMKEPNTNVVFSQMGGKLKVASNPMVKHIIAGQEGYDSTTRHINGYIRKLPEGQRASDKAIQLAQSLGYQLRLNETYVAPFERVSWYKVK